MKLRKGDEVQIVAGKDKGKTGKVEQLFPKLERVLVTGMNQYKRHKKAKSQNEKSEIVILTKPLPVANVQLVCPKCKLVTRVGYSTQKDSKERICRKCNQTI